MWVSELLLQMTYFKESWLIPRIWYISRMLYYLSCIFNLLPKSTRYKLRRVLLVGLAFLFLDWPETLKFGWLVSRGSCTSFCPSYLILMSSWPCSDSCGSYGYELSKEPYSTIWNGNFDLNQDVIYWQACMLTVTVDVAELPGFDKKSQDCERKVLVPAIASVWLGSPRPDQQRSWTCWSWSGMLNFVSGYAQLCSFLSWRKWRNLWGRKTCT